MAVDRKPRQKPKFRNKKSVRKSIARSAKKSLKQKLQKAADRKAGIVRPPKPVKAKGANAKGTTAKPNSKSAAKVNPKATPKAAPKSGAKKSSKNAPKKGPLKTGKNVPLKKVPNKAPISQGKPQKSTKPAPIKAAKGASEKAPKKTKSGTIRHEVFFPASPETIFEILMDEKKHAIITEGPVVISQDVGGEFSIFDGYATGIHLELDPGKLIVQTWRASDWPEEAESIVRFELEEVEGGTRLLFTQEGVPRDQVKGMDQGWCDFYWEPILDLVEKDLMD